MNEQEMKNAKVDEDVVGNDVNETQDISGGVEEQQDVESVEEVDRVELENTLNSEQVIATMQKENEQLKQQLLRSVADYTNLKQRTDREKREILSNGNAKLISKLLPVLDNFERALISIEDENVASGLEMIYRQLFDFLQSEGLEKINAEGQQFDPHIHDALMQEHNDQFEDNTVIQVFEPGYRFNNKLLRAAKVKVSSK